ncbi:MAG TPA: hypothetical protein P5534_18755, partial [Candidatus Paceibacterota bacterium]|nr:hypothetical protein [Candidatus Paceibacterota bacterium]HRZ58363.1 hypothetical protein [Candidatus Paceibacterota bacterium]
MNLVLQGHQRTRPWLVGLRSTVFGIAFLALSSFDCSTAEPPGDQSANGYAEAPLFDHGVDPELFYCEHEIEANWKPAYLERLKQTHPAWRAAAERDRGGR